MTHRPVQLAAGLLRRDGRLLLCHRHPSRANFPNVWDVPGGHVDPGESLAGALVRELDEELGIRIDIPEGPPWTTLRSATIALHIFLVDRWQGDPQNLAPEEHDEIRWFNPDELAGLEFADSSYLPLLQRASAVSG